VLKMKAPLRSHFVAGLAGGAVVAAAVFAFGLTGHRTVQTIVAEAPLGRTSGAGSGGLTPNTIYERDAPAVAYVRARIVQPPGHPFDVLLRAPTALSTGSAFLIDRRGYLLTAYHLIAGAARAGGITVQFQAGDGRPAVVVGQDPANDLALLKLDMTGAAAVRPLVLGDSTTLRVGDPAVAIGNPAGSERTLTMGIVSSLQRELQGPGGFAIANVIQTDARIDAGSSGGPLLDATGRVIGIDSQIDTGTIGAALAFAIPINTAKELLSNLGAPVRIADLGIRGAPTPGPAPGVIVQSAASDGPAARAGVRRGDEIDAIGGQAVFTMKQLDEVVAANAPGQSVRVLVRRDRHPRTLTVQLVPRAVRVR
jgi:S1-C subfamily serine protease